MHWRGFPREEREWLKASELQHAPDAITDFHCAHPAKPHPMPTMKLHFHHLQNFTMPNHILHYLFNWEDRVFDRDECLGRNEQFFNALDDQPQWLQDAALERGVMS